jgi:choline-sulfatase
MGMKTGTRLMTARPAYLANVSHVDAWLGRLYAALEEYDLAATTTIVFTADRGNSLGERGLWYKMSFYEWSCRMPFVVANTSCVQPQRVAASVTLVDVLPTLLDVAHASTGAAIPEPIDPLDGDNVWPLCTGSADPLTGRTIASEFLSEGTRAPMLMLRDDNFKYISRPSDPELLFDLINAPSELNNLVDAHQHSWDFRPHIGAANSYIRSHMDLSVADNNARYAPPCNA